jgi:hypothetical protein
MRKTGYATHPTDIKYRTFLGLDLIPGRFQATVEANSTVEVLFMKGCYI